MTHEAAALAQSRGADFAATAAHRSRLLRAEYVSAADLVVAMSREHRREAVETDPASVRKVFTAREFGHLLADVTDDQLRQAAGSGGASEKGASRDRLGAGLNLIAQRRGTLLRSGDTDEDVVDPYRRSLATYERSAAQLDPALRAIERVIRVAVDA